MADVSSIKLPNNTTVTIADTVARTATLTGTFTETSTGSGVGDLELEFGSALSADTTEF